MDKLETFNTPGMFHEGVLYIDYKPQYIVEYYDEAGVDTYVTVYEVDEASLRENAPEEAIKNPRKAYEIRRINPGFREDTRLSTLAAERFNKNMNRREEKRDKPPVFTAPVQYGRDTFYGIEGMGFYERTKDRYGMKDGKPIVEGGHLTGVFIALDSIDWRRRYVPTEEMLNQYVARVSMWDDFR